MRSEDDEKVRAERAHKYFETLWGGPEAAAVMRDRALEYQPDHCELSDDSPGQVSRTRVS